jgi:NAD(P)-dependent dehydrogenase (short-subunit alcohol dehydrogenase family)
VKAKLKPLGEQIIVLTGATSGIGLVTARRAARARARLVLAARNEPALEKLKAELEAEGAQVAVVVADVGREQDVRRIAETAIARFGGFDTWINNAAVSIYGKVEEVSIEASGRSVFFHHRPADLHRHLVLSLPGSGPGDAGDDALRTRRARRNGTVFKGRAPTRQTFLAHLFHG